MTRELFVSSTPHETKVGLVEDDQLAEVYLERENEYTLAGSIYKGKVTRVLPGMQSAFVDIGLERDAFLYVSDFMELESQDEDLDDVPATPAVTDYKAAEASPAESPAPEAQNQPAFVSDQPEAAETKSNGGSTEPREERGGWRNRRRRRGRRDRGNGGAESRPDSRPESRHSRPPEKESRPNREEYGPPPGYQPIILPGESISKYRGFSAREAAQTAKVAEPPVHPAALAISANFPEDEPLFTQTGHETEIAEDVPPIAEESEFTGAARRRPEPELVSEDGDREPNRLEEMNVAAVFGGEVTEEEGEERAPESVVRSQSATATTAESAAPGTMEHEEIDEEEADLASYVEELEEDAAFDEMEEETHTVGDYAPGLNGEVSEGQVPSLEEVGASAENGGSDIPFSAEPVSEEIVEVAQTEEVDEAAEEDAELEDAQAEAEALLDSEGRENGMVDARAELRAPAATAAYTRPGPRPSYDRDRGRRRFRGGRRFRRNTPQNLPQISDLLKEGQEVLVQIAKEPIGKKGARITSHIALPGRFLVYMPTVNHTGVSRKIASEEERQRLKRIIQSERENGHGGFIVRTAAQGADEQELRADIRFLKGLWNEIRTRAENSKAPALIYHDLNVVERVLRDQVTSDFSAVWVDSEQEYERILRFANRFQPALVRRVKLYTKETPLFEQFGLKDEIDKALKSKVWLKSGGYIVINQTEALVAIDVNTGKYVGKTARLEDTIVKTNVDAIKEIVRQIRLRDLGGIIVIDFIDMDERRNRQKVMQALEEALRSDRSPSKVLQFNDFGLVAITRKRVKQSLERTIGSPCPYCDATGFVKNVNTVCNEIYVEMRKIAKHLEHSDVMLRVSPDVAKALKANNGRWLNEVEELTKKTVIVKSDPALHQEQFDIN